MRKFYQVFFIRICHVLNGSQGQTQSLFLVCNLRPDLETVKFDVRRSLEPFKDFDGHFDPSLTALTKRSLMVHVLRPITVKKRPVVASYSVTITYYCYYCKSAFISKSKLTYREYCMVNLLSLSLTEGQLNVSHERSHLTNE